MGVRRTICLGLVVVYALALAGCSESDHPIEPADDIPPLPSLLRAETELTTACYDWPVEELSLPDAVEYAMQFEAGDPAIDFTLRDVTGATHRLSGLLETRPVLLVFGAFT